MSEKDKKRRIVEGTLEVLNTQGPPHPSFNDIAHQIGSSRQLIRYYFSSSDDLMLEVCDLLAEAYRMALVNGASAVEGSGRLAFIFDFYFDLVAEHPKPRDDQAYDAVMAMAAGSDPIRQKLQTQYALLGQVLQLELKMQYPDFSLEDCAEISYLFVCLMYGHWKMVASLGVSEDHKLITRRAIDRIIASYQRGDLAPLGAVRTWDVD